MKLKSILSLSLLILVATLTGCKDNNPDAPEGKYLTVWDLPVIDGSDSTEPLRTILVSKLLGCSYEWHRNPVMFYAGLRNVHIDNPPTRLNTKMINSNTHPSFVKLIDGEDDIIITARGLSRDETKYANEKGVKLLEKPIAMDGLVFIVNAENPVKNLTHQQIKDIYLKRITNWKEVGGDDAPITPYIRNANSGSQEKFETMVMEEEEIEQMEILELEQGHLMTSPYEQLRKNKYGIAFTPYYYYKYIVDWDIIKTVAVNGVEPNAETLERRGTPSSVKPTAESLYPFSTTVMAAIREDCPKDSQAAKIYDFLSTPAGQAIVTESGYIPYN